MGGRRLNQWTAGLPLLRLGALRLLAIVLVLGVLAMHGGVQLDAGSVEARPVVAVAVAGPTSPDSEPAGCCATGCDDLSTACSAVLSAKDFAAGSPKATSVVWSESERKPAAWRAALGASRAAWPPVGLAIAGWAVMRI